jgi:hypothetical protein
VTPRPRRWWPFYVGWLVLCAILFVALRGAADPSRPKGRLLPVVAGDRALAIAKARGYRGYEVVQVARAKKGEGAPEDRWVVLLDQVPHTSLRRAVVIELAIGDGTLLRIRKPR